MEIVFYFLMFALVLVLLIAFVFYVGYLIGYHEANYRLTLKDFDNYEKRRLKRIKEFLRKE